MSFAENAILYYLLKKGSANEITHLTLSQNEILIYYFIIGFYFNTESPKLDDGNYKFELSNDFRAIFLSLDEIEEVTNEAFDMILHAFIKGNKIIIELGAAYKEALMIFKNME